MAKTKLAKQGAFEDLSAHLKQAKSVVFANFQGLKVKESEELRKKCREQDIYYVATKKTLLRKALSEAGYDIDTKSFQGGVSVVFGEKDEVAPSQVAAEFAKTHEAMTFFGGILEGKFIDAAKIKELSKLPSKKQLLGQLVGTINAPISGFVNALAGNIRNLANVLNAIKDSKAEV